MGTFVGLDAWFNTNSLVKEKTTCGKSSFSKYCMIWYNCQGHNFGFVNLISYCFKYCPGFIHAYYTWSLDIVCMKIVLKCVQNLTLDALISLLFSNVAAYLWYAKFSFCLQLGCSFVMYKGFFNHLNPISDKNRISPYNINTIPSRQVTRIEKSIN